MVSPDNLTPLLKLYRTHGDNTEDIVIMEINLLDLRAIFQRALNTWSDVPPYILTLSDKLEKL